MRNVYLDAHLKYKFVTIVKYVSITLHLSKKNLSGSSTTLKHTIYKFLKLFKGKGENVIFL